MSLKLISEYNQTYRKHTSCYYRLGLTLCYTLDQAWANNSIRILNKKLFDFC